MIVGSRHQPARPWLSESQQPDGGGPDPRHLLIREIHEVRWIVGSKKDRAGNPVDCVRIVFLEEWMARHERRPLLDVGARIFFMNRKTGDLVEIAG